LHLQVYRRVTAVIPRPPLPSRRIIRASFD
jgi:hypothetical protein